MTRHGSVLPIPTGSQIAVEVHVLIEQWPEWETSPHFTHPRSAWLSHVEDKLRAAIPGRSSRDYNLTARSLAPFPLAEKDWL